MIRTDEKANATPHVIEQKYLFTPHLLQGISDWLEHTCFEDPAYPRNLVQTIFFDTAELDAYWAKINGDFERSKYRLRWYGGESDADSGMKCFFETKRKIGSVRTKDRCERTIPRTLLSDDPLSSPDTRRKLMEELDDLIVEHGKMQPVVLITYNRSRYVDFASGSRIAVDTDISCVSVNDALLPGNAPTSVGTGVLEVKGHMREMPESLFPIVSMLESAAFSKYVRCVESVLSVSAPIL